MHVYLVNCLVLLVLVPFINGKVFGEPKQLEDNRKENEMRANERSLSLSTRLWESTSIPYEIVPAGYNEYQISRIQQAMDEYSKHTCISFRKKTNEDRDYILIRKLNGCSSNLGRTRGAQNLTLGDDCFTKGMEAAIIHELMHSLGFSHEHVRFDRDEYVDILWENLNLIPPEALQVEDDSGPIRNGLTSAYAEGASTTLTCSATGGKPLPRISWSHNGNTVAEGTEYFPDRKRSQSVLKIAKLTRAHLLATYSCEASNSRVQRPLVVRVAIDMYLRPLEVELVGKNRDLSAGRTYEITCRCKGSRPPATITWWKDGVSLEGGAVSVSADGNTTQSVLHFTPTAADHGLILSCKASNQRIPFSELQRTWMLRVFYLPKVTLSLGHGLNATNIREGADVYFNCHIVANPWVNRVKWLRDGQKINATGVTGVLISNQTLVLQRVTRKSAGRYCCEATNTEGSAKSPPFALTIKYEPVCGDGNARKVLGAAKGEPLKVECKVDAEPAASLFHWSFNSTPGISRELNEFIAEPGTSVLTYVPKIAADYGTLQCWGRNELGSQRIPCTYHIVPAGRPDPPISCAGYNETSYSIQVRCDKGFDGGLKQKFNLLVSFGDSVISNLSAPVPEFNITNLEPANEYKAIVFALNAKGWSKNSDAVTLKTLPASSLKEQRRITEMPGSESRGHGPWLYILLAAGSTLIVAAAIGAIIFAIRKFRIDSPVRERRQRSPKREETPLNSRVPAYTDAVTDEKNPDLIPPTNESLMECGSLIGAIAPYTITARPSSKRNCATQMPVKPYHVTWAPILQSRNCSTQTPPPHKESSV